MERKESNYGLLDMIIQPAFLVREGLIAQVNEGAKKYFLEPGTPIEPLLLTGKGEYQQLEDGCLFLTLSVAGLPSAASVRRMDGAYVFTLEQEADQSELQAMALAAQELRMPLSNVMAVADQLFPIAEDDDPYMQTKVSQINRGLFQLLRIVSNMSDAYRYSQQVESRMEVVNVTSVFQEIFEQSAQLLRHTGTELRFQNLEQPVFSLADQEKLGRAVHNIISNAVKFAGKGSHIEARLRRNHNMLYLTVQDSGEGIAGDLRSGIHNRYRRRPGLEDSRYGIGLGMVMIRAAAAAHGGTLLIDHPDGCGTRITMSMTIRQDTDNMVRDNSLRVDYAGERDHALIELSDILPIDLYNEL